MEILSTGEKIKRARVYKGLTLKQLCDGKISVSKMSCIENNKIKADGWILEFVAETLELELEYLTEGIEEQIKKKIDAFKNVKEIDDEELKYLIEFSEEAECYNLAVQAMHLLFKYYLNSDKIDKLQGINSKYYTLCQKAYSVENQIVFYSDEASYFYRSEEYSQAKLYFENVCEEYNKMMDDISDRDYKRYMDSKFNLAVCEVMLDQHENAYVILKEMETKLERIGDDTLSAMVYDVLTTVGLQVGDDRYSEYENLARGYYGDKHKEIAIMLHNIGDTYLELKREDEGIKCLTAAFEIFPKEEEKERLEFIVSSLELFIKYKYYDTAAELCDEALNVAILLNDIKIIEKAYYYKAILLFKSDSFTLAEMYMNLSLDSLKKFGNRDQLRERYNEMGHMYYKVGNSAESLKYFEFAIKLNKIF